MVKGEKAGISTWLRMTGHFHFWHFLYPCQTWQLIQVEKYMSLFGEESLNLPKCINKQHLHGLLKSKVQLVVTGITLKVGVWKGMILKLKNVSSLKLVHVGHPELFLISLDRIWRNPSYYISLHGYQEIVKKTMHIWLPIILSSLHIYLQWFH